MGLDAEGREVWDGQLRDVMAQLRRCSGYVVFALVGDEVLRTAAVQIDDPEQAALFLLAVRQNAQTIEPPEAADLAASDAE